MFSPGNDGAVAQTNTAVAAADTSGDNGDRRSDTERRPEHECLDPGRKPRNLGSSRPAEHGVGRNRVAVSTTTNGLDTNLSVVVDGNDNGNGNGIQQPGANGLQVWEWTWNWDRDESVSADALLDANPRRGTGSGAA